jgi:prepilin-type N-terminal cleavage/methylation domain-containing protein
MRAQRARNPRRMLVRQSDAFTLVELLVVILVLAVLVAVAVPPFLGQTEKARESRAKQYLAVAYRAAAADSVARDGRFGTAAEVAAAIKASEPELDAATGFCPDDATGDPTHIVVDSAATGGADLELCADPERRVWILVVHNHRLEPPTSLVSTGVRLLRALRRHPGGVRGRATERRLHERS